jgi:Rieske Fe-S protein
MHQPAEISAERRGFLVRTIQAVHAGIAATLAVVVGGAVAAPSFSRREPQWLDAGAIDSVEANTPLAVTLRVARPDGATEAVDRRVIYLVRGAGEPLKALDSTCTHLGCRTRFNADTMQIECPCHGGRYDISGNVVAGPPPSPLRSLQTRVQGGRVLVEV